MQVVSDNSRKCLRSRWSKGWNVSILARRFSRGRTKYNSHESFRDVLLPFLIICVHRDTDQLPRSLGIQSPAAVNFESCILKGNQTENDDEMAMGEIIIDQQGAGA
jgi:hypothetical protein